MAVQARTEYQNHAIGWLGNAETAAMLFWALTASAQITMRCVDGWQTLDQAPVTQSIDLAA